MIWASDAAGRTTYMCHEWEEFTGQPVADALAGRWIDMVHPDDRAVVAPVFHQATEEQREFWMVYRLRTAGDGWSWVLAGAVPSTAPTSRDFLGFLGSITVIELRQPITAHGELGPFRPPPAHPATAPKSHLDMLADLAIVSRAIAEEGEYGDLVALIDDLVGEISVRLAKERQTKPLPM